jgi:putative MATE family efflux protein
VDTAIVGHLGTPQLAALALAGAMLTGAFTIFNFLTYGTTAQVARYHGAGREDVAGSMAAQALWLATAIGVLLLALGLALAVPAVHLLGGAHRTGSLAVLYLRIGALGLPFALIALAGQGYLRGVSDLRTPLVIVVVANLVNVVLEVVFVYVFGWGLAGSAWGTVIAQAGMGAAFAAELLRAPAATRRPRAELMRPLARVGSDIFIRTASLYASFLVASAVLARIGAASLAAHQVAFQLWTFLALVLDAVAIAGQVIVGRALGASRSDEAWDASMRMLGWSFLVGAVFALGLLTLVEVIPHAFTDDPLVINRLHAIWPIFALMQPANALVFALDGILIGASDTRFLKWSMAFAALCVFAPVALMALAFDWGIVGVWCGLLGLIVARLVTCGARFRGRRWAVVGVLSS